jgi:hypothetical protein
MVDLVLVVSAFSRAEDSGPKCGFRLFRPEFWPRASGYLCQAGDSGQHDFGAAHAYVMGSESS